ncbi:MAG: hypothetical protein WAP23_00135, partial [Candidatus Spechtbacterales bacterium]
MPGLPDRIASLKLWRSGHAGLDFYGKVRQNKNMSGHSKWKTTKHHKAAVDAKRGKVFAKLAKIISIA